MTNFDTFHIYIGEQRPLQILITHWAQFKCRSPHGMYFIQILYVEVDHSSVHTCKCWLACALSFPNVSNPTTSRRSRMKHSFKYSEGNAANTSMLISVMLRMRVTEALKRIVLPVVRPAALREMFSSLVYLSIICWMLLSLNRESTARPERLAAELSMIQELWADGDEIWSEYPPRPGSAQCLSDGDLSMEEVWENKRNMYLGWFVQCMDHV